MGLVRLGIANPSANTATTLLTSDNQYLVSIIAANKSTTTAATIRIWVEPSGSSTESEYAYYVYDLPIDASNSYETFRFAVNQNDLIKVRASSANVSFSAYGIIQYDIRIGAGISSYSPTAPSNPVDGMIWVDSDGVISESSAKPIYVYSSETSNWLSTAAGSIVVPYQPTAPPGGTTGDLWVDSVTFALRVYNGSSWVIVGDVPEDIDGFFLMGA